MQDFKKLEVWQKSHELTLRVYELTQLFPTEEKFGLTSQLRRAVVSVELNLAEGSSRGTDADFNRFVQMAIGSASEVECQLLLARDVGFLSAANHAESEPAVQRIKRMLIRLSQRLTATSQPPKP
jgi:four helix bundle protein